MLFTGEYEHSIDAKLRLSIPAEVRNVLNPDVHGEGFYAVPGPNGALWLWPQRTFEDMSGAMDASLLPDDEMLDFEDWFFSQAARLEIDSAGRVRLPERLLRDAGIEKGVTILGVRDHLELRDPKDWSERLAAKRRSQGEIMLRARQALAASKQRRNGTGGSAEAGA